MKHLSPASLGRWSARRPWLAFVIWLPFVVACIAALVATGSNQLQSGATGESARAEHIARKHGIPPSAAPMREYAYVYSASLTASDPAFRAVTRKVATTMKEVVAGSAPAGSARPAKAGPGLEGIVRPPARVNTTLSADGHSAVVAAAPNQSFSTDALGKAVAAEGNAHVSAVLDDNTAESGNSDLHRAEYLSVPVTLLVLLIAFGALVASLVPVLLAVTAVIAAFGLLGPISHAFALDPSVKTVVLLIGM